MAGVSTKEIKNRIRSMESTKQITKAMEMVAASKLRRAQMQVNNARPYFETLRSTIEDILSSDRDCSSPFLVERPLRKTLYVVIAGDRGLAGGYNSNVLKMCHAQMKDGETIVLPIGKKAAEFFRARKLPLLSDTYAEAEDVSVGDCFSIANSICSAYVQGAFDAVYIAYTRFVSVLSQNPQSMQLLPLVPSAREESAGPGMDIIYEPDSVTVFDTIVPEYLGGVIYGALCESRASEQAARRTAMDSATQNADEMIANLSLKYNQARQAAITQEITEIVAGA